MHLDLKKTITPEKVLKHSIGVNLKTHETL